MIKLTWIEACPNIVYIVWSKEKNIMGETIDYSFPWSAKSVSICKRIYSTYIIMITEIKKQILFVNGFNTVKQNWQVNS